MSRTIVRNVIRLVILIMAFESVSSAMTASPNIGDSTIAINKKSTSTTNLVATVFANIEERSEEEIGDHLIPSLLTDFSSNVFQLFNAHSAFAPYLSVSENSNAVSCRYKLYCTYLI